MSIRKVWEDKCLCGYNSRLDEASGAPVALHVSMLINIERNTLDVSVKMFNFTKNI